MPAPSNEHSSSQKTAGFTGKAMGHGKGEEKEKEKEPKGPSRGSSPYPLPAPPEKVEDEYVTDKDGGSSGKHGGKSGKGKH
jgi:hypothetical protein